MLEVLRGEVHRVEAVTVSGGVTRGLVLTRQTHHSLYWSLNCAFQPSGTFGGGGPVGGRKSDIMISCYGCREKKENRKGEE